MATPVNALERVTPFLLDPEASFAAVQNLASRAFPASFDEAMRDRPSFAPMMLRDTFIWAKLQERMLPVNRANWEICPVDESQEGPIVDELAKKYTRIIRGIPDIVKLLGTLNRAVWFGKYAAQLYWGKNPRGETTVLKWIPFHGDKIQFGWDGVPYVQINPMYTGTYGDAVRYTERGATIKLDREEWADQLLIHTNDFEDQDFWEGQKGGSIYGTGLRDKVYWTWWLRSKLIQDMLDTAHKQGTGGIWVIPYVKSNAEAKAKAVEMAANISKQTAFIWPVMDELNAKPMVPICVPPQTGGITALQSMITDYFDPYIQLAIVGQSLSSGTEGSGLGGTGVANLHADTKYQLMAYDADNLSATMTKLLQLIQKANDPLSAAIVPLQFKINLADPSAKDKLDTIKLVGEMGFPPNEDEVRQIAGVSPPPEDDLQTAMKGWDDDDGEALEVYDNDPDGGGDEPFFGESLERFEDDPRGEHWVTIGGHPEGKKKHVGGFPVQLDGAGTIIKGGPAGLKGKNISEVKSHFQKLNKKRGYQEKSKLDSIVKGRGGIDKGQAEYEHGKERMEGAKRGVFKKDAAHGLDTLAEELARQGHIHVGENEHATDVLMEALENGKRSNLADTDDDEMRRLEEESYRRQYGDEAVDGSESEPEQESEPEPKPKKYKDEKANKAVGDLEGRLAQAKSNLESADDKSRAHWESQVKKGESLLNETKGKADAVESLRESMPDADAKAFQNHAETLRKNADKLKDQAQAIQHAKRPDEWEGTSQEWEQHKYKESYRLWAERDKAELHANAATHLASTAPTQQENAEPAKAKKPNESSRDTAVSNLPLDKRGSGSIDSQIDKWKRDTAKKESKQASENWKQRAADKDEARKLFDAYADEIAASTAGKHGLKASAVKKELDRMVKWEPSKALKTLKQYQEKQANKPVPAEVLADYPELKGKGESKAKVVPAADFKKMADKGARILHRGVPRLEHAGQFDTGDLRSGKGAYGEGIYAGYGSGEDVARQASMSEWDNGEEGHVARMALSPDAKMGTWDEVETAFNGIDKGERDSILAKHKKSENAIVEWAKSQGYDALDIEHNEFVNILNPSKVAIEKDDRLAKRLGKSELAKAESKSVPAPELKGDKASGTNEGMGKKKPKKAAKKPWEMTKKEFDKAGFHLHKDIRSKTPEERETVKASILSEGMKRESLSFGNTLPAYRGGAPMDIVQKKYAPMAGNRGYLLPEDAVDAKTRNYKDGHRPEEDHVIDFSKDYQSAHEAAVETALKSGKRVPPEVLAEYPELEKEWGKKKPK